MAFHEASIDFIADKPSIERASLSRNYNET